MKIIHIAAECYPLSKTGGLGDVVGALPKYLNESGIETAVIVPAYRTKNFTTHNWVTIYEDLVHIWGYSFPVTIYKCLGSSLSFETYAVDVDNFFKSADIYTNDDTRRFFIFQRALLQWLTTWEDKPTLLHCHDHHTALIPFLVKYAAEFEALSRIPTVFTIHNGLYQGMTSWDNSIFLPAYDTWHWGLLDWNGMINPMASAIKCSWAYTTVSNGYLDELTGSANGLESLIRKERYKAEGIVNGIDTAVWDPATDKALARRYSAEEVFRGKEANKLEVCGIFGLDPDKPLYSFIGRLVPEKGSDLLAPAIYNAIIDTHGSANFLVLGSGAADAEQDLNRLRQLVPPHFNCYIGYNEYLSHKIYAAADFMLMPSRMEPCGLNQLYALRYGTMPIVSAVGGLNQTIRDIGEPEGFGIKHIPGDVDSIRYNIQRGLQIYNDVYYFHNLRREMMHIDHSWERASKDYIHLYQKLINA